MIDRSMSVSQLDNLFDGDTEEDEPKLIGLKRPSDNLNQNGDNENPTDELIKRTVKKKKVFTEDILTGCDGLIRIYEDFPREKLFMGRGYELQDMKRLLHRYKEWGFQMFPGLAFPDLLSRCESFGSKARTRNCLKGLRDRERDNYVVRLPINKCGQLRNQHIRMQDLYYFSCCLINDSMKSTAFHTPKLVESLESTQRTQV